MRRLALMPWVLFVAAGALSCALAENLVWTSTRSWPSALMNLPQVFILLPAALAGWSAWRGWVWHRTGAQRSVSTRSGWQVLASWLSPALWVCVLAPLLAVAWMAPLLNGSPRLVDLSLIGTTGLLLTAWTLLGFLIGSHLPLAVGVPLATVAGFVGMAFPEASNQMALRHILALHSTCCLVSQEVSIRVLIGSNMFYLVLVLALALIAVRPTWRRVALGGALTAVTTAVCLALVSPVAHPNGVHERPADQLVCRGERPRVCLWPEQEEDRALITETAQRAQAVLTQAGLHPPESLSARTPAAWNYQGGIDPADDDLRRSVVAGLVSVPMPACARTQPWSAPSTFPDLASWIWISAGYDRSQVTVSPGLAPILSTPLPDQRRWFAATMARRTVCGPRT